MAPNSWTFAFSFLISQFYILVATHILSYSGIQIDNFFKKKYIYINLKQEPKMTDEFYFILFIQQIYILVSLQSGHT